MNESMNEYWRRIFLLQDYIENHPEEKFTSQNLAAISGFSKYHFHRIFKGLTKESLFEYITRIKMESAVGLLRNRPDLSITEIAYQLGFSDSAVFARRFKTYYGLSAKEFREEDSNNCKSFVQKKPYDKDANKLHAEVKIEEVNDLKVIYKRKIGAYKELESYEKQLEELFRIALKNELLDPEISKPLAIYHSDPDITSDFQQRTSVGLIVKKEAELIQEEEVLLLEIPSGLYGICYFEIELADYPKAWDYVYGSWLVNSGFLPRHGYPFEVYLNNPFEHPEKKHQVAIYVPIEPIK